MTSDTTTTNGTLATIRAYVRTQFAIEQDDPDFSDSVHLFEEGYVDSIGLVSLIAYLEAAFEIKLGESVLFSDEFTTVEGIASVVDAARADAVPLAPAQREGQVRPFTRADLPAVTELYEEVMRSGTRNPPPGLASYIASFFLDHPHVDPELPSLVYEGADGRIVGFIGSHTRRLSWRGERIRLACSGQFVVEAKSRSLAAGTYLLKAFFDGPQDLTVTDGGVPALQEMWEGLGGKAVTASNVRWTKVFRPWRHTTATLAEGRSFLETLGWLGTPVWAALDGVTRLLTRRFRAAEFKGTATDLTPESYLAAIDDVRSAYALVPEYDEEFLRWQFAEMKRVKSRGPLRARALRAADGGIAGWYVAYLPRGRQGSVVSLAAAPSRAGDVLSLLFADAEAAGVTAVFGRVEPGFQAALHQAGVAVSPVRSTTLVHTRRDELYATLFRGDALLTRFEGEWWAGFQHEPHQDPV